MHAVAWVGAARRDAMQDLLGGACNTTDLLAYYDARTSLLKFYFTVDLPLRTT